jgi:hypothetical protein
MAARRLCQFALAVSQIHAAHGSSGVGIAHLNASFRGAPAPKILALAEATYFAGLQKAGMPDE